MRHVSPLVTVLALCLALTACGDEQKEKLKDAGRTVGEKTAKTWTKLKTFTAEHKDEAVALWDKSMGSLEERLEKAKAKSGDWSEDAKKGLAEKWKNVEAAYAVAKAAGADGWQAAHDAFVAAHEAFQEELTKHE